MDKLTPGPKKVEIISTRKVNFAPSTEELAKKHAENVAKGNKTGIVEPADLLPPNAEGNNAKVELTAGAQQRDFALKKPSKTP